MNNLRQLSEKRFYVDDFYENVCSQFNMGKKTAVRILRVLEEEGHIQIIWHSPRGAHFLLREKPPIEHPHFLGNFTESQQKCSQLDEQPSVVGVGALRGVKPREVKR